MADSDRSDLTSAVREYWDAHTLGKQYVKDPGIPPGTPEYFAHVRAWMNPYKFPEIMPRIERAAARLRGRHLLEVGCGMGFDSVELMKRGVRVTATDLTPNAVELARRHFEIAGVQPVEVGTENVLELSYPDATFDGVWACGVLHHTGDVPMAVREIGRVLRPGGVAFLSHFYRRPSWMHFLSRAGRENIEFSDADPPVTEFLRESEILASLEGFIVEEAIRDHYRALPIARTGVKALLYKTVFRPCWNLLPAALARTFAYKFSVIARKP
ncbi:MAG: class I SAM-dependent methyltransferase [Gemmatimonadota bacterium]|jgi:2-polyprenyl-3-methyl-5-hydroxy-6-metoxy-1,4-benzoquinol methylase